MSASDAAAVLRRLFGTDSASASALGVDSAFDLDDRRLRILMRDQVRDSVPRFLADPALILIDGLASAGGAGEGRLAIPRRGSRPVVDFRSPLERDVRDALDRDVDLVVTRDPSLVDYVATKPEFTIFPLPWSRTYVLLHPGDREGDLIPGLNAASVRSSLAQDAVRADARGAEPPYWWSDRTACGTGSTARSGSGSSRIVYPRDDEVARNLAERIVALAPAGSGLRAAGLESADLARSLQAGSEGAYVIGLPSQSLALCRDASVWPAGARLLPLVDTRAYAIVRKGAPPLTVEWDGTLRVMEP